MTFSLQSGETIVSLNNAGKADYLKLRIIGGPIPKASLKTYFNKVIAQLVHYQPKQPEIKELKKILKENLADFLEDDSVFFF